MNQLVKQNYIGQGLAIAERTGGMSIAPRNVADVIEFGHLMSTSGHAVPKHLRGNPGACMAVAMQAFEWEMSPFAVARKTYMVNDNIAYEAQLIAAVINTRAGLKQRLAIEWHGEGAELFCTVRGEFRDGSKHTYTSPTVGSITTKNSPLWKSDPRQQIAYFSVRSWGRLYAPEVILGIYDRDEVEQIGPDRAKDITPVIDPFSDAPPNDQEGQQDAITIERQDTADAETLTGEADSGQPEDNSQSSELPSSDEGSGEAATSPSTAADLPPADEAGMEEGDNPGQVTTEQAAPSSTISAEQALLLRIYRGMADCVGPSVDDFNQAFKIFDVDLAAVSDDVKRRAETIRSSLEFCCGENPKRTKLQARAYIAGLIRVDEAELD